jgi:hypothetical protein
VPAPSATAERRRDDGPVVIDRKVLQGRHPASGDTLAQSPPTGIGDNTVGAGLRSLGSQCRPLALLGNRKSPGWGFRCQSRLSY